jgi:hypothetical protein
MSELHGPVTALADSANQARLRASAASGPAGLAQLARPSFHDAFSRSHFLSQPGALL